MVDMAIIHISEAEAARDFPGLMARLRAGEKVVIEKEASPALMLRVEVVGSRIPAGPGRLLSEAIASAEARGSKVTLDGEFGRDLEAAISGHREPLKNPWD